MDAADDLRLRQYQQVVVALEVMRMVFQAFATVIGLGQAVALDHRAHGAVQDKQALLEEGVEFGRTVGLHRCFRLTRKPRIISRH